MITTRTAGSSMMDLKTDILAADNCIRPFIRETPLEYSIVLSHMTGCEVYLKCENLQHTGSFKVRGAFNKLLLLNDEQRSRGIVTASSGNHGLAVAFGLNQFHIPSIIFMPENASSTKVENIRHYGVPIEFYEKDMMLTEAYARDYAKRHKMVYISPYNDLQVISGQGTIGIELMRQLDAIDTVFACVGGGGLISGVGAYLKSISPQIKIIGCLPENSPVMAESIKAGHILEMETRPTLSDATAGGIEPNAITFNLCQQYVDEFNLVTEDEIEAAIIHIMQCHHFLIEGASGVALAAFIKNAERYRNKKVVVVLSGANISLETLKMILN